MTAAADDVQMIMNSYIFAEFDIFNLNFLISKNENNISIDFFSVLP